jgi:hypothetical protein
VVDGAAVAVVEVTDVVVATGVLDTAEAVVGVLSVVSPG